MKKLFKYTMPALALCALASCSDDTTGGSSAIVDPNAGKELIAFSEDAGGITRASITRANPSGFDKETKVSMRIMSEADGKTTRYTEATATATEKKSSDDHNAYDDDLGEHSDLNYDSGYERYWDDAHGRESKLTVYAVAVPDTKVVTLPSWEHKTDDWNQVNATTNPNWYQGTAITTVAWSVPAQQPDQTTIKARDLVYSNNISSYQESAKTVKGRYVQKYNSSKSWDKSMDYGRMIWEPKTDASGETTGKFDQGHLVFNHALSWITLVLKEDAGFDNTKTTDFVWTNIPSSPTGLTQSIALKGFPTSGELDVSKQLDATDLWESTSSSDIVQMAQVRSSDNKTVITLDAYVLPGTNLLSKTDNVLEFEIDNAKYYVTGKNIADAIQKYYTDNPSATNASIYKDFSTTQAGKHYYINLKVAKKGITDITAAIVDWETVNSSDVEAKNTYPTFTLDDRNNSSAVRIEGSSNSSVFNLYRSAVPTTDYITLATQTNYDWTNFDVTPATKTWVAASGSVAAHWSTNWFWENNQTYYHFRAAGSTETDAVPIDDSDNNQKFDQFFIHSGAITSTARSAKSSDTNKELYINYRDYTWGAPFVSHSGTFTYDNKDSNGFDGKTPHQISSGFGANEATINMLLFHMTSQIYVNVRTTTDANTKVRLDNGSGTCATTVEILNFLPDGTVRMGDGLVTASGTRKDNLAMINGTYKAADSSNPNRVEGYEYGMVPQPLTYGSGTSAGTIGLRITTPDGNKYLVKDLSNCYVQLGTSTLSTNNLANPYTEYITDNSVNYYKIDRWYPNYKYYYTITLQKTGIQNITAAVVDWETVTGDLGTINLEN